MKLQVASWLGLGGVPPGDHPEAYRWERRLHWVMIGVALLSLPVFYLEELASGGRTRLVGSAIEAFILLAFSAELLWMLRLTRFPWRYLARNWLDVLVIAFTVASLAGVDANWVTLVRLTRIGIVGLLLVRALSASSRLLRRGGLPYLLVFGFVSLLMSGFGFYWLEPTVHSYGEGLWLAFVTGATIGYGDFVPSTTAARFFAVFIVVVGVATMSMVTASIAALLVGEDERRLQQEIHDGIRAMREEISRAIASEERALLAEMHRDLREVHRDMVDLRAELARLRERVDGGTDGSRRAPP